jgi:hypothetical protein
MIEARDQFMTDIQPLSAALAAYGTQGFSWAGLGDAAATSAQLLRTSTWPGGAQTDMTHREFR